MSTTRTDACRETLRNTSAYLDGELDPTACDIVEQHSLGCPACATMLNGLKRTTGLCRQAAGVTLPAAVRARAKAAVRQLLERDSR
jgi:anti-sigma factor RsiW